LGDNPPELRKEEDITLLEALCRADLRFRTGELIDVFPEKPIVIKGTGWGRVVFQVKVGNTNSIHGFYGREEEFKIFSEAIIRAKAGLVHKEVLLPIESFLIALGVSESLATSVVANLPPQKEHDILAAALLAKETSTPFLDIVATI
jgi:hypothetical protein